MRKVLLVLGAILGSLLLAPMHRAVAQDAPTLPPYFTTTNPDPAAPLWPDQDGGAAGTWAAPAGDAGATGGTDRCLPAGIRRWDRGSPC